MVEKQKYLVSVRKMCVDDELGDVVAGWTAIVDHDKLDNITLSTAAALLDMSFKDAPVNLRPMTEDEIIAWRESQKEDDEEDYEYELSDGREPS